MPKYQNNEKQDRLLTTANAINRTVVHLEIKDHQENQDRMESPDHLESQDQQVIQEIILQSL